jgi:hypothetical protein
MFLRATTRKKDGKLHHYWSIVENRRVAGGRVVQRHVLYLGEINSSQELAWRKSIEVLEDKGSASAPRTYALFPEDRCERILPDESIVRLKLKALQPAAASTAAVGRVLVGIDAVADAGLGRAASGGCTASGIAARRSPIYSVPMTHWPIRTCCTGAIAGSLSTKRHYSTI